MTLLFLNGGGMRGGPLHHQLQGAALVRVARSAARYRYYSVGDRFPAMREVPAGGRSVLGEVYDVPLSTLRDHLLSAEPPELELGVIELDDGTACLATVLRQEFTGATGLVDISDLGDWCAYQASGAGRTSGAGRAGVTGTVSQPGRPDG
ncbi:MAG TPA: gamma-glutamylcyclotransferase [Mycobacteriales bacterium]|nr:gamma-glutamylcyclotransferase [Mycobacteriales bacterium]